MKQKKLLILGGTNISQQILYAAKEIGYLVYVADYLHDSPCKTLADKSFNISATDVQAISELIRNENIDGVIMGYADILLNSYVDICNETGLPCYANKRAIEITSNKEKFKALCREFDIPVVEEYSYDSVIESNIEYPILIKPVDNSGARGIYPCHSYEEFEKNYEKALDFSPSKKILIEPFLNEKEATIFYYIHNGESYLLGVGDRWMYEQNNGLLRLPIGYTFPSFNIQSFIRELDPKFKQLFKALDMREGMAFIQTFIKKEQFIIYEMGYRLTGSLEHHIIAEQYGFNHLKELVRFAVGDKQNLRHLKTLNPEECCMGNVSILLNSGTISEYQGLEKLENIPGVVHFHVSHEIGTKIDDSIMGKLAQIGIRILLTAPNENELIKRMDDIKNTLAVIDSDGKDMILRDFSYKTIVR